MNYKESRKIKGFGGLGNALAERAGFEPALGYHPKHAFQACDLNHSSTSPWEGVNSNGFGQQGEVLRTGMAT